MTNRTMLARSMVASFLVAGLSACVATADDSRAGDRPPEGVQVFGALRAMFHEGRTAEVVNLGSLLPNEDLYAVGALAGLRGEVTIIRGEAFLSYPDGTRSIRTEARTSTTEGATLLVAGQVSDWVPVSTDRDIGFEDLDQRIAALAASAGLDPGEPFPFVVEGEVRDLRWHVIDGSRLSAGGRSHQDHMQASVRTSTASCRATLVGFYSEEHQGVFTHMGSKTHVHCVVAEPLSAGHVDHVVIPAGTTVLFPAGTARQP